MDVTRAVAGIMAGSGAITLILTGHIQEGTYIIMAMLGFFIGEKNGERKKEA